MSTTKHTPGEWKAYGNLINRGTRAIAKAIPQLCEDEEKANARLTTTFWHVSNGQLYTGRNDLGLGLDKYKSSLRRAYGSLRGIKVIEATDEESAYRLAFFGMGAVSHQWLNVDGQAQQVTRSGMARFV